MTSPNTRTYFGVNAPDRYIHATTYSNAGYAECGTPTTLAPKWGPYRHGSDHGGHNDRLLCPRCMWTIALRDNTTDLTLQAIAPTGRELDALRRLTPDPMLTVHLCRTVLTHHGDTTAPHPGLIDWLTHITAHRLVVLLAEDCAESACDHIEDSCYQNATTAICDTCSLTAGPWAGEWEGHYEVIVTAPCSALTAVDARVTTWHG